MRHYSVAILLISSLVSCSVFAQEMNYNTFQIGSRSSLMGGAVVAGVRDSSATFYNPAALIFAEEESLSVSANAFRFGMLTIKDALGEGQDAEATLLDPIPLLLSGIVRFASAPDWAFGYALLTRQQYSGDFRNRLEEDRSSFTVPGIGTEPFRANVIAQANLSSQVNEIWAMAGVSRRLHNNLAVGIAPIISLRNHSRISRVSLQTIPAGSNGLPIGINDVRDTSFFQFSFLARAGIAWEPRPWLKVGATVTTPNLKIAGDGESLAETIFTNLPLSDGQGNPILDDRGNRVTVDLFGSDFQEGRSTNYRTPFSAAVGIEVKPWAALTLGISAEYFAPLGREAVVDIQQTEQFLRGIPPEFAARRDLTPLDERQALVNVSFGAEYTLSEIYAAYLGFWTDFSPINNNDVRDVLLSGNGFVLPTADVDIYHFVLGATRTSKRSRVAAGVVFSYGTGTSQTGFDATERGDVLGSREGGSFVESDVAFFTVSFLLGYTYFF